MSGLDELFSRLKSQEQSSQSRPSSSPYTGGYQPPTVSSPLFSPPVHTPNPVHPYAVLSPVNPASTVASPAPTSDASRSNNLLNLLKFNGQSSPASRGPTPLEGLQNVNATPPSTMQLPILKGRDTTPSQQLSTNALLAALQRKPSEQTVGSPAVLPVMPPKDVGQPSQNNTQDFLLNLLTRPKISQATQESIAPLESKSTVPTKDAETDQGGAESIGSATPFDMQTRVTPNVFKYVNPFEQLHSSSPLNRNTSAKQEFVQPINKIEIMKHSRESSSQNGENTAAPVAKSRKLDVDEMDNKTSQQTSKQVHSVSQALQDVAEEAGKQVENALAKATEAALDTRPPPYEDVTAKKATGSDDVESSWESAEDEAALAAQAAQESLKVDVYNFPMKPFVSLQIKPNPSVQPLRQENFMVIAQLKKEFDQIDRCLTTASQSHIVYAQAANKKDNSGFRVIRQDTGDHKQIFRSSAERIFNIQLCSSPAPAHDVETVIATGVEGTVYWTSLAKSRGDLFKDDDIEGQGFVLPPVSTAEENSSGSPVKTRAKMSSRHPEYFAIARGKQIYIIAPEVVKDPAYCHPTTRKVDGPKFFAERTLKINTGKAGKDFCFSEDDTIIASLDKNGRFKFWDVRDLTKRASDPSERSREPVELREPLWTLNAATSGSKPDEKPSVSSIMFLDKDKPTTKGIALRYLIIGFKQNHILQLWDLAIGKAVQEVRLPHEKDSDGICSISYHAKTGIIAIGHPTRNSIYFIHLSAPAYNLTSLDQASYIGMLARGDSSVPRPDTTAIMSGLREFSFAKVGQLRSVDMLKTPVDTDRNETLFELYIMHSKGVIGVTIKREDLGWDEKWKVINAKDAVAAGLVQANELVQTPKATAAADPAEPAKSTKSVNGKVDPPVKLAETKKPSAVNTNGFAATTAGKDVAGSSASKSTASQVTPNTSSQVSTSSTSKAEVDKPAEKTLPEAVESVASRPQVISPPAPVPKTAEISVDLQAILSKQFEQLYQRVDNDKRVQEAASGARQDALLRLVSSTLTENVDKSLSNIIATRIEQDVLPALANVTTAAVERRLAQDFPPQLKASLSETLKDALPTALQEALKSRDVHQTISNITGNQVALKVQQQVSDTLQNALPRLAMQSLEPVIAGIEKRLSEDNAKIEQLSSLVQALSSTMQSMAESTSAFQEQILQMQRDNRSALVQSMASPAAAVVEPEPEDPEVAALTELLVARKYEDATVQWIQSDRQALMFDKLFVRLDPSYLQHVSPLVALTVSAAITSSFATFVPERLSWLGQILQQINVRDGEIADVAPRILDILSQRLQGAYMQIAESNSADPSLRAISALSRQVNEIRRM